MRTSQMQSARTVSLYGALLTGIIYAALALNSEPAFAGTCTAQYCAQIDEMAELVCSSFGGVLWTSCNPGGAGWAFGCVEVYLTGGDC